VGIPDKIYIEMSLYRGNQQLAESVSTEPVSYEGDHRYKLCCLFVCSIVFFFIASNNKTQKMKRKKIKQRYISKNQVPFLLKVC